MAFENSTPASRTALHPELENLDPAELSRLHPDGAIYVTETEPAGKRFRLRHAQPARWQPVREKDETTSVEPAAPAPVEPAPEPQRQHGRR